MRCVQTYGREHGFHLAEKVFVCPRFLLGIPFLSPENSDTSLRETGQNILIKPCILVGQ